VRSHPNPAPMPVVASAVQEYVLPVPDETINEKVIFRNSPTSKLLEYDVVYG